ncbi:MAG: MarR family transcriptional regulator [Methylococcaceae bacterium]
MKLNNVQKSTQEIDFFEIIKCMAALIRSEERKKCTKLRLQLIHFEVLQYLSHSNQYTDTPAATASYFGMTRGTVSQSLIVLEKKGYLEKSKDKNDKRVIHITLLPSGQAILKKARRSELYSKATKLLKENTSTPIKINIFFDVLNALQKALQPQSFNSGRNKNSAMIKNPTIFDLIELMAILIRSEERKKCTELKLQMVHFQVLEYLSLCNKYSDTAAAITNYLGMTRGTVSQTLILLEKRKFIKKNQDLTDKRVFHIQLLKKGFNILNRAKPTDLFKKASIILKKNSSTMPDGKDFFIEALTALQKANNSYSFGICITCKNFMTNSTGFFCQLTQENLSISDSEKICQEHVPI